MAQVDFAVQSELALSLRDFTFVEPTVLSGRQPAFWIVVPKKERMKDILEWSPQRLQKEIQLYQEEVHRSRQWQE